jgi:hypothetical protein
MSGQRPYLHPGFRQRTMVERRLAEIMDLCHVLEPEGRVDIFEVVQHLQETKRLYEQEEHPEHATTIPWQVGRH